MDVSKLAPKLIETEIIDFVTKIMPVMILFISSTSFFESKNIVESSQTPNEDIPINKKVPIAINSCELESSPFGLSSSLTCNNSDLFFNNQLFKEKSSNTYKVHTVKQNLKEQITTIPLGRGQF